VQFQPIIYKQFLQNREVYLDVRLLGTNLSSLKAQRQLSANSDQLAQVYQRLASGQRINSASDDAAGLSLSENLRYKTAVANQGLKNINDSISLINIADAAYESLNFILERQIELAQQASNGIFSADQRNALNNEYTELTAEYERVLSTTVFNGISIFSDLNGSLRVQAGGNHLTVNLQDGELTTHEVGNGTYDTSSFMLAFSDASLLIRDINGSGRDDLIIISAESDGGTVMSSISVYLANTDGSYTLADSHLNMNPGFGNDMIVLIQIEDQGSGDYGYTVVDGDGFAYGFTFSIDSSGDIGNMLGDDSFRQDDSTSSAQLDANGNGVADFVNLSGNLVQIGIQQTDSTYGFLTADLSHVGGSLTTMGLAQTALSELKDLLEKVSGSRGVSGASLSRLSTALSVTETARLENQSARERVLSSDVASDAAEATALSIAQQVGTAVLAQANLQPSLALLLLESD